MKKNVILGFIFFSLPLGGVVSSDALNQSSRELAYEQRQQQFNTWNQSEGFTSFLDEEVLLELKENKNVSQEVIQRLDRKMQSYTITIRQLEKDRLKSQKKVKMLSDLAKDKNHLMKQLSDTQKKIEGLESKYIKLQKEYSEKTTGSLKKNSSQNVEQIKTRLKVLQKNYSKMAREKRKFASLLVKEKHGQANYQERVAELLRENKGLKALASQSHKNSSSPKVIYKEVVVEKGVPRVVKTPLNRAKQEALEMKMEHVQRLNTQMKNQVAHYINEAKRYDRHIRKLNREIDLLEDRLTNEFEQNLSEREDEIISLKEKVEKYKQLYRDSKNKRVDEAQGMQEVKKLQRMGAFLQDELIQVKSVATKPKHDPYNKKYKQSHQEIEVIKNELKMALSRIDELERNKSQVEVLVKHYQREIKMFKGKKHQRQMNTQETKVPIIKFLSQKAFRDNS